ncbi:hypothetical protein PS1_036995 [Malus domestica]
MFIFGPFHQILTVRSNTKRLPYSITRQPLPATTTDAVPEWSSRSTHISTRVIRSGDRIALSASRPARRKKGRLKIFSESLNYLQR